MEMSGLHCGSPTGKIEQRPGTTVTAVGMGHTKMFILFGILMFLSNFQNIIYQTPELDSMFVFDVKMYFVFHVMK